MAKRGWSREFPYTDASDKYTLDGIPPGLWRRARAKAKREGVSIRTLLLRWLTAYVQS